MASRANPRLVGAFVLVAVGLMVIALVVFGSGRLFRDSLTVVSFFDGSVSGLAPGAPVRFRGVEIGEVKEIRLNLEEGLVGDFSIPVIWELDIDKIRARGGVPRRNWEDPAVLDTLIHQNGLRARLGVESLVTGRLFLDLDVYPDREAVFVGGPDLPYPEVPTLQTEFREIQEQIEKILAVISAIEVEPFVDALTGTFSGVREFVSSDDMSRAIASVSEGVDELRGTLAEARSLMVSVDTTLAPLRTSHTAATDSAAATLGELRTTLESVRAVIEPGSPLTFQLEQALTDLASTARSLRSLAESLERNPSSLIRGKPTREEQ